MTQRLSAEEERFRLLVDEAADIITLLGVDGTIHYQSPAIARVLGYEPGERIGKNVFSDSLVHPDDSLAKHDFIRRALAAPGATVTGAFRLRHADGTWRSIEATGRRPSDGSRTDGIVVTYRHIPERARASAGRNAGEERLRLLMEGARDLAIIMLDREGRIIEWNRGAQNLFGYQTAEVMGCDLAMLMTPENRRNGLPEQELQRAERDGRAADNTWLVRRDGSRFWASGLTVALDDGELRGFAKVVRDLTEHRRMEEALEARALQQQMVAELGRRAVANPDLGALFEDAVQIIAQTLGVEYAKVLELLPDGDALLLRAGTGWQPGLAGHATVGAGMDSQAGFTLASTSPVIVADLRSETRFQGPPLLFEHGVVSGMSVIIHGRDRPFGVLGAHSRERRDFTEDGVHFLQAIANVLAAAIEREATETRLARERREAARLAELDSLRADFVASVSHDLRTPLTAIRAAIGLLEQVIGDHLPPAEATLLLNARRNAERLDRQIEDLLTVNQLEAGVLRIEFEPLDLRTVVTDAISAVHPLFAEKGQVMATLFSGPLECEGDARWLERVFVNILTNAHAHTPEGTRITVTGERTEESVMLAVADTGPGIPPGEHEAIFQRFYRLNPEVSGSGIGLAIARQIVELHGGRVWVENGPEGGSVFRFAFIPATNGATN